MKQTESLYKNKKSPEITMNDILFPLDSQELERHLLVAFCIYFEGKENIELPFIHPSTHYHHHVVETQSRACCYHSITKFHEHFPVGFLYPTYYETGSFGYCTFSIQYTHRLECFFVTLL